MADVNALRKGYHDLCRREILELIPTTAKTVLDLGCGSGELGKALKQRQVCYVRGVELNKAAVTNAQKHLDGVICDNLNRYDPTFSKARYDCLIFADILEHLINPWGVLKKFVSVLEDGGTVIASIPNIAHPWVSSQLQKGLFRYAPAGVLDITHLRFFTKTTIGQMFYRAGLKIVNIRPYPSDKNPIQYLVTATRPVLEHKNPLTTILILTFNGWCFTRQCIESIKKNTSSPYQILAIDNGSTDDTIKELRKDKSIMLIENSCNLGFGRGLNIGLASVTTPYFVICGTDTVVTKDWLNLMLKHIKTDDKLLCLGPVSNAVSGPQVIKDVPYKNITALDNYAKNRIYHSRTPLTYFKRIVFFFTLFRTDVVLKAGLFDERYEIGNYEDDDYCMRINKAGYKTAFDNSVFIHHYGSQTFKENKIDFNKSMAENQQKFMKKWNFSGIQDYSIYLNT